MLFVAMLCVLLSSGCSTPPGPRSFPAPATLPPCAALPDPLVMLDGRRVSSPGQWFGQRRPELMALFQHYMYGILPPKPAQMRSRVVAEYGDFAGVQATLRLITLETGSNGAPQINLMLVLPNHRTGPVPVFLGLNFCGNQSLTDDPRVPLARGWLTSLCKGCSNNVATEAARAAGAADWPGDEWPVADIVERGYGLATFCSCDIDSDRPDISDGLYQWLAGGDPAQNRPADRGTIAAWAWGLQRCVDYLEIESGCESAPHCRVGPFAQRQGGAAGGGVRRPHCASPWCIRPGAAAAPPAAARPASSSVTSTANFPTGLMPNSSSSTIARNGFHLIRIVWLPCARRGRSCSPTARRTSGRIRPASSTCCRRPPQFIACLALTEWRRSPAGAGPAGREPPRLLPPGRRTFHDPG